MSCSFLLMVFTFLHLAVINGGCFIDPVGTALHMDASSPASVHFLVLVKPGVFFPSFWRSYPPLCFPNALRLHRSDSAVDQYFCSCRCCTHTDGNTNGNYSRERYKKEISQGSAFLLLRRGNYRALVYKNGRTSNPKANTLIHTLCTAEGHYSFIREWTFSYYDPTL